MCTQAPRESVLGRTVLSFAIMQSPVTGEVATHRLHGIFGAVLGQLGQDDVLHAAAQGVSHRTAVNQHVGQFLLDMLKIRLLDVRRPLEALKQLPRFDADGLRQSIHRVVLGPTSFVKKHPQRLHRGLTDHRAIIHLHNTIMSFMSDSIDSPIIIDLPYEEGGEKYDEDIFARALQTETHQKTGQVELSNVTKYHLNFLLHYPAVYVIHAEESHSQRSEPEYCVYVGETNDISQRTYEHLYNDPQNRDDWRLFNNHGNMSQYVITHPYFNKSLTLDIENQLMLYMSSVDHVSLPVNKRVNPQRDYYTHDRFKRIFSDIWLDLHRKNPSLFPAEGIILDSALFKASPFHKLSDEQLEAENIILSEIFAALHLESPDQIATDKTNPADSHLILVQGAAGTGKTVLLSHLFYRLLTQTLPEEDAPLIHSPASAWKSDDNIKTAIMPLSEI